MTYVYDLETFKQCFIGVFKSLKTKEILVFEISDRKNQWYDLMDFLADDIKLVGFNNLRFDGPVLEYVRRNEYVTAAEIAEFASNLIENQDTFPPFQLNIPQLDLYAINHYSNPNKRTSLKWIEFTLRNDSIEDLPYEWDANTVDIDHVIQYCVKDINITERFYFYCKDNIKLRQIISKKYGINALNYSDTKIGTSILTQYYSKITGVTPSKENIDNRKYCSLKDVISSRVSFHSPELKKLLINLKNDSTNLIYQSFKSEVIFDNQKYEILKGGLHSVNTPNIYKPTENTKIIDLDFGSYYPGLIINLGIYPPQLGKAFIQVVKMLTDERLKAKKNNDKVTSDALKISINSIYGTLGNEHFFTYSPTSLFKVTINGQLFLMMLIEKLTVFAKAKCFYANTKLRYWCCKTFLIAGNSLELYNTNFI